MSPPLLSDYKRTFAGKRICQNLLGGLRLLSVPYQYILIQILLFAFPVILLVIVEVCSEEGIDLHWKVVTFGLSLLLLEVVLDAVILVLKKDRNIVKPRCPSLEVSLFAQEDEVNFEGWLAPSTWAFLAPNVVLSGCHLLAVFCSTVGFALNAPLLLDTNNPLAFRILALLVLMISRFSATLCAPPEIATFDTNKKRSVLYRPLYSGMIGLAYFFHTGILKLVVDGRPYLYCISLLLLGWSFGFLPPLDSLVPWATETVLRELGGCPSYYYFGSFIGLCLSISYILVVFVVGSHEIAGVTFQCAFGYFILLDTSSFLSLALKTGTNFTLRGKPGMLIAFCRFAFSVVGAVLVSVFQLKEMQKDSAHIFVGITVAGCACLHIMDFTCFRKHLSRSVFWMHFCLTNTFALLLHIWLTVEIVEEGMQHGANEVRSLSHLTAIALSIRAYASAATCAKETGLNMIITAVLRMTTSDSAFPNQHGFTIILFLVAFARKSAIRLLRHLVSVIRIMCADFASPLLDDKQNMAAMCLLTSPISLGSLILGSLIEGCTLTPLFTLPVFILGYPRPLSFWKGKWFRSKLKQDVSIGSLDEAIYAAISPALVSEIVARANQYGPHLKARDAFVARYEDRLLFLRILGSGINFVYVGVKGLELQEQTSCHHQESAWMDEIFERNAVKGSCPCSKTIFKDKLTVVWPLFEVKVPSYSESKSTIPYLSLESEKLILEQFFFKSFAYLWIKGKPAFEGEAYWGGKRAKFYGLNDETNNRSEKASFNSQNSRLSMTSGTESENITEENVCDNLSGRGAWPLPREVRPEGPPKRDWKTAWIKKCVGESIPSNAIKDRMERLVNKIWKLVHNNNDFHEIKLHRYFEDDFLRDAAMKLKTLETDNIVEITRKSFRYSAKLTLDEIYQLDFTEDSAETNEDETFAELSRFEEEFSFCSPTDIASQIRNSSVSQFSEIRIILSMMPKEEGMSLMRIFAPEITGLDFKIGGIDKGVLEGIWSNLNLELLYLTSDDDERFSIQHDRHLMRNLCTECADSPLGYPVYEAIFRVDLFRNYKIENVE